MADKWISRWYVGSDSNPDKTYTVAVDAAGNFGCSCPAWTPSKQRRQDCKHIKRVKAPLARTEGRAATAPVPAGKPEPERKADPGTRAGRLLL
jgi:hypothetical protein